ncbi:MAG: glycerol-3-phosphate dehydrogenase/oxidase [Bacteroidia bacterium]|nr:glycerol-3-phosphate dehydrogenase/oxidase [Bacteroidia bacterium]
MTGININRNKWSVLDRAEIIKKITSIEPDILVIGGGITGAGIALDAASRGLKVAVVEKQDFSAGTSSRSTKLIHGGLRYLAQFEFRLVRNIGTERKIIYNHAQHIVFPEKMLLPVIKNGTYTRLAVSFGVFLYDIIAGVDWKEQCKMLNKKEMLGMEPLLNPDILKAGVLYYEYKTKDSRLTVEIFKKAVELGALAINYFEAETFIYENGKITGIIGNDTLSGKQFRINAKFVVNASGPWVDKLREKNHSLTNKRIHLTKGVHIVVSKTRLPLNHSVYFDVGDERMIFTIPEDNCVYIGTTDTDYNGNLEHPSLTQTDALYLIKAVNNMFPSVNLTIGDIISSWAGLRPLIHKEGKKPSELSRRDEIFISKSGLISIAGGKLTGYRTKAKKIVDIIMKKIVSSTGQQFIQCKTNNIT